MSAIQVPRKEARQDLEAAWEDFAHASGYAQAPGTTADSKRWTKRILARADTTYDLARWSEGTHSRAMDILGSLRIDSSPSRHYHLRVTLRAFASFQYLKAPS